MKNDTDTIKLVPTDEADATVIGEQGTLVKARIKSTRVAKGGWSMSLADEDTADIVSKTESINPTTVSK